MNAPKRNIYLGSGVYIYKFFGGEGRSEEDGVGSKASTEEM